MYPNRYICTVLDEMRACFKTRNFASLLGLIEEAQSMANRMESSLEDVSDIKRMQKEREELNEEIKVLKKEAKALGAKSDAEKFLDGDDE